MVKTLFFYFFALLVCFNCYSKNIAVTVEMQEKLDNGEVLDAIKIGEKALKKYSGDVKKEIYYLLACSYSRNQDMGKSLENLLNSVIACENNKSSVVSSEENKEVQKALKSYLKETKAKKQPNIKTFFDYKKILDEHKNYHLLRLYSAVICAKNNMHLDFCKNFYLAAKHHPKYFLTNKTKGVLCLRLIEHKQSDDEKKQMRKSACKYLYSALKKQPKDTSLYKRVVYLTDSKKQKKERLIEVLNIMMNSNVYLNSAENEWFSNLLDDFEEKDLKSKFSKYVNEKRK